MRYQCTDTDTDCDTLTLEADTAREAAEHYVQDYPRDGMTTVWHYIRTLDETGDEEDVTIAHDPIEPTCTDADGHSWTEGPVRSSGGSGVAIDSTCDHCGLERTLDGGAQDQSTGIQGLQSVTYRAEVW